MPWWRFWQEDMSLKQQLKRAELIWSHNPGCFESHLQRRCDNPLFPPERRIVTQPEIDAARARDVRDAEAFREEVRSLAGYFGEFAEKVPGSQVMQFRKKIEDLMQRAAELGGNLQDEKTALCEMRKAIIGIYQEAIETSKETIQLQKAEAFNAERMRAFHTEFLAQMLRQGTPITPDDLVPALLSEDLATIQLVLSTLGEINPKAKKEFKPIALQLVAEVEAEAGSTLRIKEKLRALGLHPEA